MTNPPGGGHYFTFLKNRGAYFIRGGAWTNRLLSKVRC